MVFHETKMGKCFFESQLPKLIQTLESISKALERKNTPAVLPVSVPENYLEELYHGNINLGVFSSEQFSKERMKPAIQYQEQLQKQLTEEQWELFLKYNAASGNYASEEACRMFQNGFRLAVNLIAAGLGTPKQEEEEK